MAEEQKKKMGRPEIPISETEFEKLCTLQCTEEDIAGWYNCSVDTINNWCKKTYGETFSEVYKKKSRPGLVSLRRSQFDLAKHNASMAIFLGKQYLGQRDVIETTNQDQLNKVDELLSKLSDEAKK